MMDFVNPSYTGAVELYHVFNRGVEKRTIFLDNADHARFVHDLYEFNDTAPAGNSYRAYPMMDLRNPSLRQKDREPLVDIHGWVLMGNHYHLLLSERSHGSVSTFLRKLNVGYANYFNEKHSRSGALFQGRTKKVLIQDDAHFLHILHYIHLNPLDFLKGSEEWRSGKLRSAGAALKHLEGYRWSSYLDYCGTKNFPSLISKELFGDVFGNYKKTVSTYLRDLELDTVQELLLE
jgi:putative transposase